MQIAPVLLLTTHISSCEKASCAIIQLARENNIFCERCVLCILFMYTVCEVI